MLARGYVSTHCEHVNQEPSRPVVRSLGATWLSFFTETFRSFFTVAALKLSVTLLASLPYQTKWPIWHILFRSFHKNSVVCDRKKQSPCDQLYSTRPSTNFFKHLTPHVQQATAEAALHKQSAIATSFPRTPGYFLNKTKQASCGAASHTGVLHGRADGEVGDGDADDDEHLEEHCYPSVLRPVSDNELETRPTTVTTEQQNLFIFE